MRTAPHRERVRYAKNRAVPTARSATFATAFRPGLGGPTKGMPKWQAWQSRSESATVFHAGGWWVVSVGSAAVRRGPRTRSWRPRWRSSVCCSPTRRTRRRRPRHRRPRPSRPARPARRCRSGTSRAGTRRSWTTSRSKRRSARGVPRIPTRWSTPVTTAANGWSIPTAGRRPTPMANPATSRPRC
jgi:hypothetical protein